MAQNLMGATTALPQVLVSQQLAASETTQYTCPAASSAKIGSATLTNTSASAVTVSLSVCKSGQTADGTHRVIAGYSVAAGDSTVLSELVGVYLGPGDFISALAGTPSAVTFVASGVIFA